MAVIKCANCENEILDTEIVCPYCDYPISDQKVNASEETNATMIDGETRRISLSTQIDINDSPKEESPSEPIEELSADPLETPKEELSDVDVSETDEVESQETANEDAESEMAEAEDIESDDINNEDVKAEDVKSKEVLETKAIEFGDSTVKISKDDIHSDVLRRSLEERKVKRELAEAKSKKKDNKIVILGVTIVAIFIIIYLIINVFSKIVGEGLFEEEKESKKSKVEVTSSAEMKDLGFEVHSHTITVIDEAIVMNDYQVGDEKPWKDYTKDITNLTIADGIETIGAHAFDDLTGLRHVTLAPSVSMIGDSAFYACSDLEKIAFDNEKSKLKSIGNYAFTDCDSLETINFASELKRIGEGAFKSCSNLEKITIPDSTTEIGADAFLGCTKLVIVCSEESYAYEYATQNGIKVELVNDDSEEDTDVSENVSSYPASSSNEFKKNETKSEQKTNESSTKKETTTLPPKSEPASGNNSSETSKTPDVVVPEKQPVTVVQPTPEPSKEEKVAGLMNQLAGAQTQEEIDSILAQIDSLTN